MLIVKCENKIHATLYPYILLKLDLCLSANNIILVISPINIRMNNKLPKKPHSSPIVQNIKSVLCSGTKSNRV
jgi:hypothetical protein